MRDIEFDCNIDLAGVSTKMPVLQADHYAAIVKEAKVEPNKEKTGRNLVVKFTITTEGVSTTGEPVNAGYPVTKYYPLQQSPNPKAPDFRRDICKLIDACYGCEEDTRPALNGETISAMLGKEVLLKLKVRSADDQYDESNEIQDVKQIS